MKHERKRISIDLVITANDARRLDAFLRSTGRKRAPWIHSLILREINCESSHDDGSREAQSTRNAPEGARA